MASCADGRRCTCKVMTEEFIGQVRRGGKSEGNNKHKPLAEVMSWVFKLVDWVMSYFWKKKLSFSVVGLQSAGKTTLINAMSGDFEASTIPTIGFNLRQVKKGLVDMKIWDLGGQKVFRESWETYCRTSDVIVYVVDSADMTTIEQAGKELHQLLAWPSLEAIPVLVLGNKNDLEHALSEQQLIEQLRLREISTRPLAVFSISAKKRVNLDVAIQWLSRQPPRKH